MNGCAAGAGGLRRLGTSILARARLRHAEWTAFSMAATCDNASGKYGGKLLVENLRTFFLSKEYSALYKVHSPLFKVRYKDTPLPQPLRGPVMHHSGTYWTRS